MRGGPETPLSRGNADLPLEQAVSPADLLDTSLEDQSIGLGPDMGRTSQNMMDDGSGAYDVPTRDTPEQLPPPGSENQAGVVPPSGQVPPDGPAPQIDPIDAPEEQPQGGQRNSGGGVKSTLRYKDAELNPNYRYTQKDYYPQRDQFVTTDAVGERMQLASAGEIPYAVLASRKQAVQSKRDALEQKKAALLGNDYGNTAPQYQQEYAKYASESQQKLISDVANSFDGDRSAALEYLTNTQEGQRQWAEHNRNVQAVGTEVKDMVEVAEDRLINHGKGLIGLSDEELKYARDLVGGYRSLGTDKEVDLNELIKNSRYLNQYMGRDKYMKEYGTDFVKNFAQTTKGIDPENPPYWSQGKLFIPVTERTTYDGLIENMSRSMTQMNMFKDVNEAKDWLQNMMPPDVKTEYKIVGPNSTSGSSESGSGGSDGGPKVVSSVMSSNLLPNGATTKPFKTIVFASMQTTGDKPHEVKSASVRVGGEQIDLSNLTLQYNKHHKKGETGWYIEGTDSGNKETVTDNENIPKEAEGNTRVLAGSGGSGDGGNNTKTSQRSEKKYLRRANIEDNGGVMETYFGTRDPYQLVSNKLLSLGYDIPDIKGIFEEGGSDYELILSKLQ